MRAIIFRACLVVSVLTTLGALGTAFVAYQAQTNWHGIVASIHAQISHRERCYAEPPRGDRDLCDGVRSFQELLSDFKESAEARDAFRTRLKISLNVAWLVPLGVGALWFITNWILLGRFRARKQVKYF